MTFETSMGDIVVELHKDEAPVTVANVVRYVDEGFYDGTIFHRVVNTEGLRVIQGGGFTPGMEEKETHDPVHMEREPSLKNERGALSMARTPNPNSATSQFFINLADNPHLDNPRSPYAVFGQVVEGMGVVDAIGDVETTTKQGYSDVPAEDVVIERATLHLPDDAPAVHVATPLPAYARANGSAYEVPFVVANGWDAARTVALEATGAGANVSVPAVDGAFDGEVDLGHGESVLVLVTVPADGADGDVTLRATSGNISAEATATVEAADAGAGPVAREENNRVRSLYVGLFDTGAIFDANAPAVAGRDDLRMPSGTAEGRDALPVWTGEGDSPDSQYIRVIPGFSEALLGLHEGESRVAYVPPSKGYQDAVDRWFLVEVVSIDG